MRKHQCIDLLLNQGEPGIRARAFNDGGERCLLGRVLVGMASYRLNKPGQLVRGEMSVVRRSGFRPFISPRHPFQIGSKTLQF